jgi:hypothetical protein
MKRIAWMLIAASAGFSQVTSIDDIIGRVAANQAKSVEARKQFVYRQEELVEELQPVRVTTDLTIGIPLPVCILPGTSVHGIGFTVSYQRLARRGMVSLWFRRGVLSARVVLQASGLGQHR